MLFDPPSSTYGRLTRALRQLYQELHDRGCDHAFLVTLSLREALLMRYESPEVIDQTFGEGVYHGIKQPQGPYARLRKLWSRVLDEQKALQPARVAALNAHLATRETCLNTGLSEREVTTWLQTHPLRTRLRPAS